MGKLCRQWFRVKGLLILLFIIYSAHSRTQIVAAGPIDFFSQLNCYSKKFAGPFSIEGNPASISLIDKTAVAVACKNRFLINSLNQYALAFVIPTNQGVMAFQMRTFHYDEFAERKVAAAFSKRLGQISLALQFHYHVLQIAGYGSASSLIPEIGAIWKIKDNLFGGVRIYRPVSIKKNSSQESFAYGYSTGIGYEISAQVLLAASLQMQEDQLSQLNAAIQYQFSQQFFASLGLNCRVDEWHADAGWKWKSMKIQSMISYHLQLGMSVGLQFQYEFKSAGKVRQ